MQLQLGLVEGFLVRHDRHAGNAPEQGTKHFHAVIAELAHRLALAVARFGPHQEALNRLSQIHGIPIVIVEDAQQTLPVGGLARDALGVAGMTLLPGASHAEQSRLKQTERSTHGLA